MADMVEDFIPHEILIRYDEEGKPQGAQINYRRVVKIDDKVVFNEVGVAQPLSFDKAGKDTWIGQTLGDVLTDALAHIEALRGDATRHSAVVEDLQARLTERESQLVQAVALLKVARDKIKG